MTRDIHTLQAWIRVVVFVAAICTTTLPVLYASLFPWRRRRLGQLFMLQAIAFALAMDLTALFSIWGKKIDILILFWIDATVLTLVAVSSLLLAIFMLRLRFPSKKGKNAQ